MKKMFLIAIFILIVVNICFGSGNKEKKFEGEWFVSALDNDGNDIILSYRFNGNEYEILHNGITAFTGLFTYNNKEITLYYDYNNKKYTDKIKYELDDFTLRMEYQNGVIFFFRQEPYFSIGNDLWNNKESLDNFNINQIELESIQGTWKHTNKITNGSTYTFSGNEFILNNGFVGKVITGTLKIDNGILILIVDYKPFGIFCYRFHSGNLIYLSPLNGVYDSLYGPFIKQ